MSLSVSRVNTSSAGRAKLDQVTKILSDLENDLEAQKLSTERRKQLLEQLKVHGRSVENSDPIFTKNGLHTLTRYATEATVSTSQEALRCIANALLLVPATRQILVDLEFGPHAAERLKSESTDDEFLLSRVLFLLTYGTTLDYTKLVDEHHLAENLNSAILRHAKRYSKSAPQGARGHTSPMDIMALCETLKLVFNITHHHPDLASHFTPSIPNILKTLIRREIPTPPLKEPTNHLINALINLDLDSPSGNAAVFPAFDPNINATFLITILDKAITSYPESELDNTVSPVLTLIRQIYPIAPPPAQQHMQTLLLPTDTERAKPLGKSDTFFSRLINLSTSAFTPTLRGSISSLLFEVSDKDAATFVHNVGYGYASGFLMAHNIPLPESMAEAGEASGSGSKGMEGVPVNPITGQRLDREDPVEGPPMTREEKEREAERLFVLFERLKATGVMDVQNPVEEAFRSGRIQELSDSDSDA